MVQRADYVRTVGSREFLGIADDDGRSQLAQHVTIIPFVRREDVACLLAIRLSDSFT